VAEENAIRRRICVVSRIRDAGYGLVAHRSLAVAAPPATTRLRPIVPEDYDVAGSNLSCIVSLLRVQAPLRRAKSGL
jgi:hypothetical protein